MNAGIFNMNGSVYTPAGTIIQNSQVVQQGTLSNLTDFQKGLSVLTIDSNGDLSYADVTADASTMVSNGIVSAVHAFVPIIINYQDAADVISNPYFTNDALAQRQLIGQYGNGDYCIMTFEGRNNQASAGFTVPVIRELCVSMGLKFAFLLDGGGSTETVIDKKQINTIYEETYGRKVPTYIVFNGTDRFFVPSEVTS